MSEPFTSFYDSGEPEINAALRQRARLLTGPAANRRRGVS